MVASTSIDVSVESNTVYRVHHAAGEREGMQHGILGCPHLAQDLDLTLQAVVTSCISGLVHDLHDKVHGHMSAIVHKQMLLGQCQGCRS